MQHIEESAEERAIQKLIDEINTIDRWRDRVGQRILVIFAFGFAAAMALLMWAATSTYPEVVPRGTVHKPPAPTGTHP